MTDRSSATVYVRMDTGLGEEIIVEVHAHIVSDMMIVHILVAV
jgi:hypothetical protein